MKIWQEKYGEEEVNNSFTRLKKHVAECWQPSWYEMAGVFAPQFLVKNPAEKEGKSNPSHFIPTSKITTRDLHSDLPNLATSHIPSPSVRQPPFQGQSLEAEAAPHYPIADAHIPSGSPQAEHGERSTEPTKSLSQQSTATFESGKSKSPATVELVSSRPKRKAREKAASLIKKCTAQGKRGSRASRGKVSPVTQRRRATAKTGKPRGQGKVDANDGVGVGQPSQAPDDVVQPMKGTPPKVPMTFDYADINLIVTASTSSDMGALCHGGASVNQEDLYNTFREHVKKITPLRGQRMLVLTEEWITKALQKHERLVNAIVLKQGYISSLRTSLDNWETVTEATREMLGKYHTREDILGTLRYEENALRLLKYKTNSVGYEITALRRSRDSIRAVEESQDTESEAGSSVFDTDEEEDMVLG